MVRWSGINAILSLPELFKGILALPRRMVDRDNTTVLISNDWLIDPEP